MADLNQKSRAAKEELAPSTLPWKQINIVDPLEVNHILG